MKCLLQLGLTPGPDPKDRGSTPEPSPKEPTLSPADEPAKRIGHYKLLEQIGEGGCGAVFLAEQEEPVRRRVALKIIKLGMDTRQVVARFEAERQALALMEHPNIAQVFDGGATEAGRPYFVMELVCGLKITNYCDQKRLSTRQRLGLFVQVCRAIQHAHQKGVIHRDLKPSNILVTEQNGEPVPKVIDFGIAKATTGQRLTDQTLFTAFEQFLGTPAYMSPEQAGLGRLDIDTRSDVYSLGVLLYELLTGQPPFDAAELKRSALDQILQTIREQEPPPPSTRLTSLVRHQLVTVARDRQIEAAKLPSLVRGDLDWIVMKCLDKDRRRRYETANGLARDVQRFLDNEPVVARPASNFYRFGKWASRNRLAFVATAATGASLLLGLSLSTWLLFKEKEAHRLALAAQQSEARQKRQAQAAGAKEAAMRVEAERARNISERESSKSRQVAQLLQEMLQSAGPSAARGQDTTLLREILDRTAGRLDNDLTNEPEVALELRGTLAEVYRQLGLYQQMEAMARQNLQLARSTAGEQSLVAAQALDQLGNALWLQGKLEHAEACERRALAIRREALADDQPDVGVSLNSLAMVLYDQGKLAEAEALIRQALAMRPRALANTRPETAQSLSNLGNVLRREGRLEEAETAQRQSLAIRNELLGSQAPEVAASLNDLATVLRDQGKLAESEAMHRQALALRRKILGSAHPAVAFSIDGLGEVLRLERKLDEAETLQRGSLAMRRKLFGDENPLVAESLDHLAQVLRDAGKSNEAETRLRDALKIERTSATSAPGGIEASLVHLAGFLQSERRYAEAESFCREALASARRNGAKDTRRLLEPMSFLAACLEGQNRYVEAEALDREALTNARLASANDPAQLERSLTDLVRVLQRQGKSSSAEQVLSGALTPDLERRPQYASLLRVRGNLRASQDRWREAAVDLARALQLRPEDNSSWFELAPVLVKSGKLADYETHRKAMLARFWATQDPALAERTALACLLLPVEGTELAQASGLAEASITSAEDPWRAATKGLAEYRQERFANAAEWTRKVLANPRTDYRCSVCAHSVQAMACWQLDEPEEAQADLARSKEILDSKMPKSNLGESFTEWLVARLLLGEAVAVVQAPASRIPGQISKR